MIGVGFQPIHPWQEGAHIDTPFYIDVSIHVIAPILGLKFGIERDQCDDEELYVGDILVAGFHILGFGAVFAMKVDFHRIREILSRF